MESPVPSVTHAVCATAHQPPKEVQTREKKKRAAGVRDDWQMMRMPFVISRDGRKIERKSGSEKGRREQRVIRMENSII